MQQMETKLGKTWGYGDCSLVEVEVIEILGRVAPTTLGQIRHGEEIKPLYRVSLVSYYGRDDFIIATKVGPCNVTSLFFIYKVFPLYFGCWEQA